MDSNEKKIWEDKIAQYSQTVRSIKIPKDLNPGIARMLISQMSSVIPDVTQDYHTLKSLVNGIDSTINIIEKKNLTGKNTEDRKRNAVLAVEMLDDGNGNFINLYEEKKDHASLLAKIEAIKDTLAQQQNLLVSMNGFMKLEERVSP
ncbi:MAG TPA: hypothetical protein VK190_02755 [Pseudoneobacillus sp.]|nr:hypothetical protein [Pseudoneobacillus sp.]